MLRQLTQMNLIIQTRYIICGFAAAKIKSSPYRLMESFLFFNHAEHFRVLSIICFQFL